MLRAVEYDGKWIIQRFASYEPDASPGSTEPEPEVQVLEYWCGNHWGSQRPMAKQFDTEGDANKIANALNSEPNA
jgi:hypothetical protein